MPRFSLGLLFLGGQQVKKQSAQTSFLKDLRDVLIPRAESAAAAAMGEYHQACRAGRKY